MNIYIGNLPVATSGDDLRIMFAKFGKVQDVRVVTDRYTRQSKRFGFVKMTDSIEAELAIEALNGIMVAGRRIKVDPAIQAEKDELEFFKLEI